MNSSMIATIYIVALVVFFALLLVMTIALVVSKSNKKSDSSDEYDDDYVDDYDEEIDVVSQVMDEDISNEEVKEDVSSDIASLDSAFVEDSAQDSAFTDSAFVDSAFGDSAFTDSAFGDSAFTDSAFVEDTVPGSAFSKVEEEAGHLEELSKEDFGDDAESRVDEPTDEILSDDELAKAKAEAEAKALEAVRMLEEIKALEEARAMEQAARKAKMTEEVAEAESTSEVNENIINTEEDMLETPVESTEAIETTAFNQEEETLADNVVEEGVLEDSAIGDSAFGDSAIGDGAFGDSAFGDSAFGDSAFAGDDLNMENLGDQVINEALDASVKEAVALGVAATGGMAMVGLNGSDNKKTPKKSKVLSTDDFYWYNISDVAEKPSYKTAEMYYHYFNLPKDCIEDLLMEMYDCALVRTEEIRYIAYGIKPRAVSMKEILTSGNSNYMQQTKLKEPSTQDLIKIYQKWCGYVDKLFEIVEIHADDYTINEIQNLLYEFGKSDVEVLLEGM